jgi:ribose transport system substrate-binding protein
MANFKTAGSALAVMMLIVACNGGGAATSRPSTAVASAATGSAPAASAASASTAAGSQAAGTGSYQLGYSNGGGVGNGFREEQVCTAKAQALASNEVSKLTVIHRNTDAAGQLSDLRTLISSGAKAIVFNPNDPDALSPALQEAHQQGIITVSVDAYVNDANTYNVYNNQVMYAELGAKWLFDQLGGKGNVWYMRGIAGNSADSDRDTGFKNMLKNYPGITVLPTADGQFTDWDPAKATQIANDFISSGQYDKVNGIWTSGMDSMVVDAIKNAGKPFTPIVGADLGAFVHQLLDPTDYPNLKGVAVTNTAAVGGAGVAIALKLLDKQTVTTDPSAPKPNTVLLTPVAADNTTDAGKQTLQSWQVDGLNPQWPLGLQIKDWTTYTPQQAIACKGPGE